MCGLLSFYFSNNMGTYKKMWGQFKERWNISMSMLLLLSYHHSKNSLLTSVVLGIGDNNTDLVIPAF